MQPALLKARSDRGDIGPDGCKSRGLDTSLRDCAYGPADSTTTVVLFGDSHAGMWLPAHLLYFVGDDSQRGSEVNQCAGVFQVGA